MSILSGLEPPRIFSLKVGLAVPLQGKRCKEEVGQLGDDDTIKDMVKTLITSRFPTTSEVARKLGVPDSRVRRVKALMDLNASGNGSSGAKARKKTVRRASAKTSGRGPAENR